MKYKRGKKFEVPVKRSDPDFVIRIPGSETLIKTEYLSFIKSPQNKTNKFFMVFFTGEKGEVLGFFEHYS